jgi:hypothetical protein
VHHLDLAAIYADRGNLTAARTQYQLIIAAPVREFNDPIYKKKASDRLAKLK